MREGSESEGARTGTLQWEDVYTYLVHPADKGIEEEGQECIVFEEDDDCDNSRLQSDEDELKRLEDEIKKDWDEDPIDALVPVQPGDDPAAVAEAEESLRVRAFASNIDSPLLSG